MQQLFFLSNPKKNFFRAFSAGEQSVWIFNQNFNLQEKTNRFLSVYHPVIITQGKVHHRPYYNLIIYCYWSFDDAVHPQNG